MVSGRVSTRFSAMGEGRGGLSPAFPSTRWLTGRACGRSGSVGGDEFECSFARFARLLTRSRTVFPPASTTFPSPLLIVKNSPLEKENCWAPADSSFCQPFVVLLWPFHPCSRARIVKDTPKAPRCAGGLVLLSAFCHPFVAFSSLFSRRSFTIRWKENTSCLVLVLCARGGGGDGG